CLATLNGLRASVGSPALTAASTDQQSCADDMATKSAEGQAASPLDCAGWAMTQCPGWPGSPETMIAKCLNQLWNDAEHPEMKQYMSDPQYAELACGFYVDSQNRVYAVQLFI
ncbi:CAP domain-containing protein, partial [Myxococcota bacterium]